MENVNQVTIVHPRQSRGVNLSQDSQFFQRDDSVKMEIHSGKTLKPANLSNEYYRMLFLIFLFPENKPLECRFPENRHLECRFLENKMDNSQNGYSSVEKTGKIKKIVFPYLSL